MREIRPAVIGLFRVSGRGGGAWLPLAALGSLYLVIAIVGLAILSGAGSGRSQPVGGSPSPTSARAAQASPTRAIPTGDTSATEGALSVARPASPTAVLPETEPSPAPSCFPGDAAGCQLLDAPTPVPASLADTAAAVTLHVPILEYHRVKPLAGETGYAVDLIVAPELFKAQMDAMAAAGWHTITMGRLGDDLWLGIQPPQKSFVVTFDDGYEDGYTYALPILRHDGFVATYFVVGGQIGREDHLTASELRALLAAECEIGNHTMNHVDMRVESPEQLTIELTGTSALIARDTGVWPQSFAYPIGLTDPVVTAAVMATPGLETAVIQGGSRPETWLNRMELPRIRVGPGTYPQDLVDRAARYLP